MVSPAMEPLGAHSRSTFGVLMLVQAAHSIEEYRYRLFDVFAPARLVSRLFSEDLALGFALANIALVSFGVWCYVARVRRSHPSARAYAWFWTLLELGNGAGHLLFALQRGAYFPGAATAPLLIVAALVLGSGLLASADS